VLPYQQLRHLQKFIVSNCSFDAQQVVQQALTLGGSSSVLSGFMMLTALQLHSVSVPSLRTLTALTRLQQLGLREVTCADAVLDTSTGQMHGSLCLQLLTRLTRVCLQPLSMFPAGAASVFSSLQRLQQLEVTQPACDWLSAQHLVKLAHLPASLTMLKLQLLQDGLHVSSTTVPGLAGLTAMQQLDLRVKSGRHGIHLTSWVVCSSCAGSHCMGCAVRHCNTWQLPCPGSNTWRGCSCMMTTPTATHAA
jgi:hypothetical protein